MGYSDAQGYITKPVSVSDVQGALGDTSTDLGTLCTSNNINKWAKFKPIKYASVERLTYEQIAGAHFGLDPAENKTLAKKSDSGVSGASVVSSSTDLENVLNANKDWTYIIPSGGSASPYRLTDFYAPANRDNGYGYCGTTKQPISDVGSWLLNLSDIRKCANSTNITHTSGSATYNWKLNDPNNLPVYQRLSLRFGEGTYDATGNVDPRVIPFNELLGVIGSGERWRLAIATQVPVGGSYTFMRLFCSRYTFVDSQALGNSSEPQYFLPAISTNQYLCSLISDYANYLYNLNGTDILGNIKLTQSHPTFSLPACLCVVKDMYLDTVARSSGSGTWERCRLNNASVVYSAPSSVSRITIEVTDDYHWSDSETEAYSVVSISQIATGQYAHMGGVPHAIYDIRIVQTKASTKTIYYRVTYDYLSGYNGSTAIISTNTVSGSVQLSNSASSFVNKSIGGGPDVTIRSKTQSTTPI